MKSKRSVLLLERYKRLDRLQDALGYLALIDGPVVAALLTGNVAVGLLILLPWGPLRLFTIGMFPWGFLQPALDRISREREAALKEEKGGTVNP